MEVYMHVDGISGAITGERANWIWLEKCTFGLERDADTMLDDSNPSDPKKTRIHAVVIEKPADRTSGQLVRWLEKGDPRTVKVEFATRPGRPVMTCTMEGAQLQTYWANMEDGAKPVVEQISMRYESLEVEYKQFGVSNSERSSASLSFELDTRKAQR